MNKTLSVIVHTKNSAATLKKCLRSVKWADQLVVCDMQSSDDSVKIAQEFKAKIVSVKDYGYVEPARNTAIQAATSDWILILDADESITPELRTAIIKHISTAKNEVWYLPRKNMMFGGWVNLAGWWPDYQLRLFKKGTVQWQKEIHSVPVVKSELIGYFSPQERYAIVHDNYRTIHEFIERSQRYSSIQAKEKKASRISPSTLFQTVSAELLRRLFAQGGINGNMAVISAALLQAMTELMVIVKAWEQAGYKEKAESREEIFAAVRNFQSELRYWIADWHVKQAKSGFDRMWWQLRRKVRV